MVNYSVDKIKLEFVYIKTDRVQSFLNKLTYSNYSSYYDSNKITKCKHNFVFGDGEGGIYVGIVPNWKRENKSDKSIVLEYNPNKVEPFLIDEFQWLKFIPKVCIQVMSFDIAVDYPIDYSLVRMLKRDVREYYCEIGHSNVETRYLGALGHNHVKLYNKALERKVDFPWTRFEITCKKINSLSPTLKEFSDVIKVPNLYCLCEQLEMGFLELDDITKLVLESIITDIKNLYVLKVYRTRKKYEKLLNSYLNSLELDIKSMYKAFVSYGENFLDTSVDKFNVVDIQSIMFDSCS